MSISFASLLLHFFLSFYSENITHLTLNTRGPWATSLTWETVPINKHIYTKIWLDQNMIKRKKTISLLRIKWSLFVKSWIPFTQERFVLSLDGWNWPNDSGEEDFGTIKKFFHKCNKNWHVRLLLCENVLCTGCVTDLTFYVLAVWLACTCFVMVVWLVCVVWLGGCVTCNWCMLGCMTSVCFEWPVLALQLVGDVCCPVPAVCWLFD